MNASSKDIKDMLDAESSLGLTFATNLFYGREPAKPRSVVAIVDAPGYPAALGVSTGSKGYEYPSVQIIVRDPDYDTGMALAEKIKNLLHGRAQETWNGTLYSGISCTSGPALLEWDENQNARFFINFNLQRRAV